MASARDSNSVEQRIIIKFLCKDSMKWP